METQIVVERLLVFFPIKNQLLTRFWLLDWRGCFGQGIKWDAPLGLNFGLGLWRLHTMPGRRLYLHILKTCCSCLVVKKYFILPWWNCALLSSYVPLPFLTFGHLTVGY
jgi:hypothetical protein